MNRMSMIKGMLFVLMAVSVLGQGQKMSGVQIIPNAQKVQSLNPTQSQQAPIKFHQPTIDEPPRHIPITDKQYAFISQINQPYSIVNTVIYPKTQQKGNFVASVPADDFVNKLKEKNAQITNNKQQVKSQVEKSSQKAHEILKEESMQQKIDENKDKKAQQTQKAAEEIQKADISSTAAPEDIGLKPEDKKEPVPQVQNLFNLNKKKEYQKVSQINQQINFKQHQLAEPLKIKNYPFQDAKKAQNKVINQDQIMKNLHEKIKKRFEQNKNVFQIEKQKRNRVETKKQETKTEKPNLKTQKQTKKEEKLPQQQQQKENPKQKITQQPQQSTKKQQEQFSQSLKIDQQYQALSATLSINKNRLKSYIDYKDKVQDQIEANYWKYLIAKVLICIVLVIAIYQATCSSVSKLTKAEKEKYAPIDTQIFDRRQHMYVEKQTAR